MSPRQQRPHGDRCFNPLGILRGHSKSIRKISKKIRDKYPEIPEFSRICDKCRQSIDELDASFSANDVSLDPDVDTFNNAELQDSDPPSDSEEAEEDFDTANDLEDILCGLKNKFNSLPQNDPLRTSILTILPDRWSIRKIAKEFGTSYRKARISKKLKKSSGILASPIARSRKSLPAETVEKVEDYYENDINSRIMANKKDTVTIRIDDKKIKKQKRLLLNDIKNLHNEFKREFPEFRIGLTKFAELRPKWCVLAGSAGTHNVCVCTIHQNFKAMIDAISLENISNGTLKNYKDCINFVLCGKPKPNCYLKICKRCPKIQNFSDYLENIMEERNISQVIFSTWKATDRCTLIKECLSTRTFIEALSFALEKLITHHFLAKQQSKFIDDKKNNLSNGEVLVQLDFSENYAYVAQNAAQQFHYNNDQCSIFPAVVYYKSKGQLQHRSYLSMSDCTTHDAAAVYLMQKKLVPEICKLIPKVEKIIYISDGAKQHFKNRYQMINLMNHKIDFGVNAEWHTSATAHGKGPPDGVGAIVKREATRASLQVPDSEALLNVQSLYNWANKHEFDIQIFLSTKKEHEKIVSFLKKRFNKCPAVTKIQSAHSFIPNADKTLSVLQYSNAENILAKIDYN